MNNFGHGTQAVDNCWLMQKLSTGFAGKVNVGLGYAEGFAARTAMPRSILEETHIHPAIREKIATHQQAIVQEVQRAVAAHAVVVVGMGMNPWPRKARQALDAARIAHHYLEYGSYLNQWRARGALKMWTGWPTLPMVFVRGTLVGGFTDLKRLIQSGELASMLAS